MSETYTTYTCHLHLYLYSGSSYLFSIAFLGRPYIQWKPSYKMRSFVSPASMIYVRVNVSFNCTLNHAIKEPVISKHQLHFRSLRTCFKASSHQYQINSGSLPGICTSSSNISLDVPSYNRVTYSAMIKYTSERRIPPQFHLPRID